MDHCHCVALQIKELRKKLRWTQQDLAEALGSSKRTIIRLEKGEKKPTVAEIQKIAELFHVSIWHLCPEEGRGTPIQTGEGLDRGKDRTVWTDGDEPQCSQCRYKTKAQYLESGLFQMLTVNEERMLDEFEDLKKKR